jgi:ubiquinone/menaquinone biosynthesis C-methylase UbiE
MPISGKFNTDSKALINRINAHDKFGSKDINDWIFQNLELAEGLSIVDLGCGTGRQSIPMAKAVSSSGSILAIDISIDSLSSLMAVAKNNNVENRITVLNTDLDNLETNLIENKYDRVLSSFSIYYTKNPEKLFNVIYSTLKLGGIFFFCGPSSKNNSELKNFISTIKNSSEDKISGGADFMENAGQKIAGDLFGEVETFQFENPLMFDSADSLYSYWSSYNLYDGNIDAAFKEAAVKHFRTNNYFITNKRVIGVKAIKH